MARRTISIGQALEAFVKALALEGAAEGQVMERGQFEDLMMISIDLAPKTTESYLRRGKAEGYWTVQPKHGKGGRGTITFFGMEGAPIEDAPFVSATA